MYEYGPGNLGVISNLSRAASCADPPAPFPQTSWRAGRNETRLRKFKRHLLIAAGEVAECKFWIELSADEGFANHGAGEGLMRDFSKLGFMIHKLWKEWRKL